MREREKVSRFSSIRAVNDYTKWTCAQTKKGGEKKINVFHQPFEYETRNKGKSLIKWENVI